VLTTLTVLNNLDSGAGSLRAEIAAAHNNDTIVFASSLSGKTITLTSGELLINHNVSITGPGAGELTVSGNHTSRVFEVAKGANSVTLSGLTISNGQASVAGGILNHGTLTVLGSTLSDNFAAGSIYVAGSGNGGGIENSGTLTVSGSTLSGNSATLGGGGIANGGKLTISNSTLSSNTSINDGGGINNDGMATISGCTLTGNSSTQYSGGGIINGGTLTVSNSTLSGNSASESGGGIYNIGTLTVSGSTLSGNSAVYEGGGILTARGFGGNTATISNCTLSGNSAAYEGGGIYATGGTLTVSNSTLTGNSATSAGGGIYIGPYVTVTVKNSSSITGNIAPVGLGADVDNQGVLDLDASSTIGILDGNPAIAI
jgi:predicted outer membrane repeat protein